MISKRCYPVYWSNVESSCGKPECDLIVRGSWFFEFNWQPLDEILANKIEKEHLERWKGIDLKEIKVRQILFTNFCLEFYCIDKNNSDLHCWRPGLIHEFSKDWSIKN